MAWAACWTLLRSRPLQQLGEQGDVGRGRPPVFCSFCPSTDFSLFLLILSHLSSVRGVDSPCPPLSLSGFASQSEIESSLGQLLCGPLLVQAVMGLGTSGTQACHETSQALLEALLQACNFVFQLLTQLPWP